MNNFAISIIGTIEKSRGLQTPEMLEQLKLRWISKLNDLCLGVTKDEKSDHTQEWVPTELEIIAPKLDGVLPVKIQLNSEKSNNDRVNNGNDIDSSCKYKGNGSIITESDIKNKRANEGSLENIPTPILSSKEMRNVNELNTEYDFCKIASKKPKLENPGNSNNDDEKEKSFFLENHDTIEKKEEIIENSNNEKSQNGNGDDNEFEDDEFGDASWDVVAPGESETSKVDQTDHFQKQNKYETSTSDSYNGTVTGKNGGNDGHFDDDLSSEQGSDLDNISDLDDEEPECSDVIIGHFEKVIRPYTRKKNQKGKWRVKLRNGIAQIANQEIPFDTLIGEFEF
ncbi:uncharacterized protein cubi_02148 [Cryptosporidium ubiquitum]|uniref:Uncharacterized protein n=1 Tax=Cryptosporidium ubiquitum TaxID=857276 RepID=A0A1J4MJ83_9CRYT|nr:uncharacterized protein cubi_02148 [Cryptosporidium ubiquitum]OII72917.1 hypothetical protein cubi_02148 [Cryptosporidium ubiquitum]